MRSWHAQFVSLLGVATILDPTASAQDRVFLVDVKKFDPTILIELRYAASRNLAGRPLYRAGTLALTRPEVAERLVSAQSILHRYNYGLLIWDAYRPKSVQTQLWEAAHNSDFVADPAAGAGSMHTWALAIDATLLDAWHRAVTMPSDFDDFTPAAMWKYQGHDPLIRLHLHLLQMAMRDAGFLGLRSEWWHFTIENWRRFLPPDDAKRAMEVMGQRWEGKL